MGSSSAGVTVPPYWSDGDCAVHLGDCREVLAEMPEASVDSIVTDPPYEYAFMGRRWDSTGVAFDVATWEACLRVLKPGGHLLAFGAPRTWHRLAVAIEDAGFEIRDSLQWVYGSGFPKSLDVSKAIDKAAGAEREVIGPPQGIGGRDPSKHAVVPGEDVYTGRWGNRWAAGETAPATEDAARWAGWGTALKPGWEPIVLARKPLDGTVAANVLKHGTGALNIDACRIGDGSDRSSGGPQGTVPQPGSWGQATSPGRTRPEGGRWPTNIVFTHDAACVDGGPCEPDCPVAELDRQSGVRRTGGDIRDTEASQPGGGATYSGIWGRHSVIKRRDDGGASRFFPTFRYEGKAPGSERPRLDDGTAHATVKPLALIRWLVRLVTQPGGLVLDPFAGSGTTLEASLVEGFQSVGVELDETHIKLIQTRMAKHLQPVLGFDE